MSLPFFLFEVLNLPPEFRFTVRQKAFEFTESLKVADELVVQGGGGDPIGEHLLPLHRRAYTKWANLDLAVRRFRLAPEVVEHLHRFGQAAPAQQALQRVVG